MQHFSLLIFPFSIATPTLLTEMGTAWKMLSTLLLAALLCAASDARKRTSGLTCTAGSDRDTCERILRVFFLLSAAEVPLLAADSPDAIPNEYLVRLNPETTDEQGIAIYIRFMFGIG